MGGLMKKIFLLIVVIALSGCSHIDVQHYGTMDLSDKTMTVPPGSKWLIGELKKSLVSSGWELSIYDGAATTSGTAGAMVELKHTKAFNARYRLTVAATWYNQCMDYTNAVNFDLSVIDNNKGKEVFTMSGNGCESDIVEAFNNALLGKPK
jgi:hypothetical protein